MWWIVFDFLQVIRKDLNAYSADKPRINCVPFNTNCVLQRYGIYGSIYDIILKIDHQWGALIFVLTLLEQKMSKLL